MRQLAAAGSEPGIFAHKSASHSQPLFPTSISRPRCASVPALASARRSLIGAGRISSLDALTRPCRKLFLAIQAYPSLPVSYQLLAACYAHMGRLDDAREIVERLRAITSVVIPDASYLRNPEHRELCLSGLRPAAGEAA